MAQEQNYPEKSFRMPGGVSAAVWSRQIEVDGRTRTRFSVKLQKGTRDAAGEWSNQEVFLTPQDIPAVLTVLNRSYEHCLLNVSSEDDPNQS